MTENLITASHLIQGTICLHSYHLDLFEDPALKRKETDAEALLRSEGISFQQEVLNKLGIAGAAAKPRDMDEARRLTIQWMQDGAEYISQGVISDSRFRGIPDLLTKIQGKSRLGGHLYVPVEIKNRRTVTHFDRLQLYFYAVLTESVQGVKPPFGLVLTSTGETREIYFTPKLQRQFEALIRDIEKVRAKKLQTRPLRVPACARCYWSSRCMKQWQRTEHVSLISGLNASMAKKLEEAEIKSCSQLSLLEAGKASEILGLSIHACQRFIYAARARSAGTPLLLRKPSFPEVQNLFFYDIETYQDKTICHGVAKLEGDGIKETSFFADDPGMEKEIWHLLLEYFSKENNPVVYCWTLYEEYFVRQLWQKYGGNENGYRNISKGLRDQCAFTKEHFVLPCRGYSIKAAAPYFGFKWRSEDANGMNCIAWYKKWLEEGDPVMKQKIIEYNLDDVRAMALVDRELRKFALSAQVQNFSINPGS